MTTVYNDLEKVQSLLWRREDMISQEDFFEVQDIMADVLLEVAKVEGKVEQLVAKFPFLYRRAEA